MSTKEKQPDTSPATLSGGNWLGDEVRAKICAGDTQVLLRAITAFAKAWLAAAKVHPTTYRRITYSEVAGWGNANFGEPRDAVQRAFLAAGYDMVDLLLLSREGRQALRDLGFEPVPDDAESE